MFQRKLSKLWFQRVFIRKSSPKPWLHRMFIRKGSPKLWFQRMYMRESSPKLWFPIVFIRKSSPKPWFHRIFSRRSSFKLWFHTVFIRENSQKNWFYRIFFRKNSPKLFLPPLNVPSVSHLWKAVVVERYDQIYIIWYWQKIRINFCTNSTSASFSFSFFHEANFCSQFNFPLLVLKGLSSDCLYLHLDYLGDLLNL